MIYTAVDHALITESDAAAFERKDISIWLSTAELVFYRMGLSFYLSVPTNVVAPMALRIRLAPPNTAQ